MTATPKKHPPHQHYHYKLEMKLTNTRLALAPFSRRYHDVENKEDKPWTRVVHLIRSRIEVLVCLVCSAVMGKIQMNKSPKMNSILMVQQLGKQFENKGSLKK